MARPLAGEVIVFTGFRDGALARRIAALGGIYKDSLSKAVTTVVCKDADMLTTNKARAARERGLRVLTREEFEASPAAAGGQIDFADERFLEERGLPPAQADEATTRARGIALRPVAAGGDDGDDGDGGSAGAGGGAELELGASRLGGQPDLPAGAPWPSVGGAPMVFLAQVDCTRASMVDGAGLLPRHGWLLFFVAGDYAGDPGAGGRGGVGAGYGDTRAEVRAAVEGADPGPEDAALAPSRVVFVHSGAALQRREFPANLPDDPAHRRPLVRVRVGVGAGEQPPAAAAAAAAPAPAPAAMTAAAAPDAPPGRKRKRGAAVAAAAAPAAPPPAPPGGGAARIEPRLLGPPAGGPAGSVARAAAAMWRDIHGGDGPAPRTRGRSREWALLLQLEAELGGAGAPHAGGAASPTAAAATAASAAGAGSGSGSGAGKRGGRRRAGAGEAAAAAAAAPPPATPGRPYRLSFMLRECDLRDMLLVRHVLVAQPAGGGS